MKPTSIRKNLLTLFLPFLVLLCTFSAISSFWLVSTFSASFFDRDLLNSSDSIVGRIRAKNGRLTLDLPPVAQAIIKHSESDKLYYRVITADGEHVSGDKILPPPSANLQFDIPRFTKATIEGRSVRLAELKTNPEEAGGQSVIVQIAETNNARNDFIKTMLICIVVPQLLAAAIGVLAAWYGISRVLEPLKSLKEQVLNRSRSDLSPLSHTSTPEEVSPLVQAINRLFERLQDEIKLHRRFISNAAHQLRTPLAGLKTYSSIGCEMSNPKELQEVIHELDNGIDRASRMVGQLLALARADGDPSIALEKSVVDFNFIVSDVMEDMAERAVHAGIDMSYECSQTAALISGEPTSLNLLVSNLLENAILYTPQGGEVLVRLNAADRVVLTVSDTGPGIPPEEREKVFERFYRVVGARGNGSGLGLAIVKEIIQSHNASINIDTTTKDGGTTVRVEFPFRN